MTKVYLIQTPKPTQANPDRVCYVLRWWAESGKYRSELLGDVKKVTQRQAPSTRVATSRAGQCIAQGRL